jgi:hypothetical protein
LSLAASEIALKLYWQPEHLLELLLVQLEQLVHRQLLHQIVFDLGIDDAPATPAAPAAAQANAGVVNGMMNSRGSY